MMFMKWNSSPNTEYMSTDRLSLQEPVFFFSFQLSYVQISGTNYAETLSVGTVERLQFWLGESAQELC